MFAYRNKKKGKRRYDCKECASKREKEKHARNTSKVNELKEKLGCVKCKDKRYYLIDFHHLNPNEKENTVARLVIHASIKDTINELKKCVPLCSNCHREFHYMERTYGMTIDEYLQDVTLPNMSDVVDDIFDNVNN